VSDPPQTPPTYNTGSRPQRPTRKLTYQPSPRKDQTRLVSAIWSTPETTRCQTPPTSRTLVWPAMDRSLRGRRTLRTGDFQHPPSKREAGQVPHQPTQTGHQQAENDEITASNDTPDDPDPPQRNRGRPRKPIPTQRDNRTPDKTTRSEDGENLNQVETPSPPAVPRRRRGRSRKDDAEYVNHQVRTR
jgi:hypothetical protein